MAEKNLIKQIEVEGIIYDLGGSIYNLDEADILITHILDIDYDTLLAFDTSEIVIGASTASVLGQAILGQMVLA